MEWSGMEWGAVEWSKVELSGVEWSGAVEELSVRLTCRWSSQNHENFIHSSLDCKSKQ